ncbi:hypothetical protein BJN44_11020 [Tessaracoccus sp. ZS01]|nr:hypothetical protein BJN44_11020 [Tessaracoccus sp. ZS01]
MSGVSQQLEFPSWIRAREIATPLTTSFATAPEDSALAMAALLRARQFDSAPVLAPDGAPVGVFRADNDGTFDDETPVSQVMAPLTAHLFVSGDTPLSTLMRRMSEEPFLFVLDDRGVIGFITPADLGTVPVRSHFYLRLAHLESQLGDYLRDRFSDQTMAIAQLSPSRREAQVRIAEDLRNKDTFVDDIACLSLDDLVCIVGKDPAFREATRQQGIGWRRATKGIADFRNDVMHPARPFGDSTDARPGKLVEWEDSLRALSRAATCLAHDSPIL